MTLREVWLYDKEEVEYGAQSEKSSMLVINEDKSKKKIPIWLGYKKLRSMRKEKKMKTSLLETK